MKPPVVVERQPVDDLVHGVAPGLEAFAVQPAHLEGAPQAFRGRIVPAVCLAAHRAAHAVAGKRLLEVGAAVLAATVAVTDHPGDGRRRNQAMCSASMTSSRLMCGCIDQPTTWRLNKSMITARYSQPSSVATYVMSLVHTTSGTCGLNCRSRRFGATGSLWLLSVVALNLRLPRARMPCRLMSLRTRSLPTRMPRASSSFQIRGQPYSPRVSA